MIVSTHSIRLRPVRKRRPSSAQAMCLSIDTPEAGYDSHAGRLASELGTGRVRRRRRSRRRPGPRARRLWRWWFRGSRHARRRETLRRRARHLRSMASQASPGQNHADNEPDEYRDQPHSNHRCRALPLHWVGGQGDRPNARSSRYVECLRLRPGQLPDRGLPVEREECIWGRRCDFLQDGQ